MSLAGLPDLREARGFGAERRRMAKSPAWRNPVTRRPVRAPPFLDDEHFDGCAELGRPKFSGRRQQRGPNPREDADSGACTSVPGRGAAALTDLQSAQEQVNPVPAAEIGNLAMQPERDRQIGGSRAFQRNTKCARLLGHALQWLRMKVERGARGR